VQENEPAVEALCRLHDEDEPEPLVVRLCNDLLSYAPTSAGPTPLPVLGSVRLIRKSYTVPNLLPTRGCSGILITVDGSYHVLLDDAETLQRQRFSFAHETVHTFFREAAPDSKPGAQEEALCEMGAAELVMPERRFIQFLGHVGVSFRGFVACSLEFDVSFDAVARRAMNICTSPACFFIGAKVRTSKQEALHWGEPLLRIVRWNATRAWPDRRTYWHQPIDVTSIPGRAYQRLEFVAGRGELGTKYRNGVCDIEASGYEYSRRGDAHHRQVAFLAKVIIE
jgi:uncharacterized protein DUF955